MLRLVFHIFHNKNVLQKSKQFRSTWMVNKSQRCKSKYNRKTLMEEIKEGTNKLNNISCSWLEDFILSRCPYTTKTIYRLSISPYQNSNSFLFLMKCILKFISNPKYLKQAKQLWKSIIGLTLPDFKHSSQKTVLV